MPLGSIRNESIHGRMAFLGAYLLIPPTLLLACIALPNSQASVTTGELLRCNEARRTATSYPITPERIDTPITIIIQTAQQVLSHQVTRSSSIFKQRGCQGLFCVNIPSTPWLSQTYREDDALQFNRMNFLIDLSWSWRSAAQ